MRPGARHTRADPDHREDDELGAWLGAEFNRHLTSVSAAIGWSEPEHTTAPVEFHLDLAEGFRATADDVSVEIIGPIERYLTRNDAYDLGDVPHILSTVWIPCRYGAISVGGNRLVGTAKVDLAEPMSSAFIAEAEVWCTTNHPLSRSTPTGGTKVVLELSDPDPRRTPIG